MRANQTQSTSNRADALRQRRTQRSQERVVQTRKAASRAPRSQPVIMRGFQASAAAPLPQARTNRVRKQYYYSLGSAGAEVRLPALPMISLGTRFLSAILVVFTLIALYALALGEEFEVRQFKVEGLQRLSYGDLEAVLSLEGSQVVEFDRQDAVQKLTRAFPELAAVSITIGLPAEVNIQVVERQPVLTWIAQDTTYWMDAEGYIIPPRGEVGELIHIGADVAPPLLPVSVSQLSESLSAQSSESPVAIWGRQADPVVLKIINDLPARIAPESKLVYNSLNGLGWEDPHGWDVFIGMDLHNFEQKLTVYEAIIASLEQQGIYPREMVSVEFINAPFYK